MFFRLFAPKKLESEFEKINVKSGTIMLTLKDGTEIIGRTWNGHYDFDNAFIFSGPSLAQNGLYRQQGSGLYQVGNTHIQKDLVRRAYVKESDLIISIKRKKGS